MTVFTVLPTGAWAASGAVTGTGTVIEDPVWQARRFRDQDFENAMLNSRKTVAAFIAQQATRLQKRGELLAQCREDLRRANRDTLFKETLRCFRSFLVGDLEIARKEKTFAEGLVGPSQESVSAASAALGKLMDAISTVLTGIDAGIYQTKDDLQEAKNNLQTKYRIPAQTALTELRLSRRATWINHLLVRLKDLEAEPDLPAEIVSSLEETIGCYEARESELSERADPAENLGNTANLELCAEKARATYNLYKKFIQEKTASGSTKK